MTDISARQETIICLNDELNRTESTERDQSTKGLWQTIVTQLWDLTESNEKMDTRSFNGLL